MTEIGNQENIVFDNRLLKDKAVHGQPLVVSNLNLDINHGFLHIL